MMWEIVVSETVTDLICNANRSQMPDTIAQWEQTAEKFSLSVEVVPCQSRHRATFSSEPTIYVRQTHDSRQLQKCIAHELTEYLLRSEWEAPYCYPPDDHTRACQRIAQMVENSLN